MSELLSAQERKKLSTRLGIDLCGGALLIVGLLYGYFSPEQTQFAALIQALAAILVGASSLYRGISGLFQQKPEQTTDQLVALAILASAARIAVSRAVDCICAWTQTAPTVSH